MKATPATRSSLDVALSRLPRLVDRPTGGKVRKRDGVPFWELAWSGSVHSWSRGDSTYFAKMIRERRPLPSFIVEVLVAIVEDSCKNRARGNPGAARSLVRELRVIEDYRMRHAGERAIDRLGRFEQTQRRRDLAKLRKMANTGEAQNLKRLIERRDRELLGREAPAIRAMKAVAEKHGRKIDHVKNIVHRRKPV